MANVNKEKKYHFTYRTTNIKNNSYYLGMHSTSNLKDGYLGSGTRLRRAIRKYGKENFHCEILEFFISREELIAAEIQLINEYALSDPKCLNLVAGGKGMTPELARIYNKRSQEAIRELSKDPIWCAKRKKTRSMVMILEYQTGKRPRRYVHNWLGKKHKPETIEKFKMIKQNHGIGNRNSQFGTCWITNGAINKKIKQTEEIPHGWFRGRTVKS